MRFHAEKSFLLAAVQLVTNRPLMCQYDPLLRLAPQVRDLGVLW